MTIARYAGGFAFASVLLSAPVAAQNYAVLSANLFGEAVPGGGAGEDAAADFDGEIDLAQEQLCYFFQLEGLSDAAAAHVHQAKDGTSGPVVMTLTLPSDAGEEVCEKMNKSLLQQMADHPGEFYIDVHTAAKPDGAVRGQFDG